MSADRYPRTELQRQLDYNRARKAITERQQNDTRDFNDTEALRSDARGAVIKSGVAPAALPSITPRMSPADKVATQVRLNELKGMSMMEARDPRNIETKGLPKPVGSPGADAPMESLPKVGLRGSTPAEIQSAAVGGPTGAALDRQNASNDAIAAARGTGAVIQTPEGTVSSTVHTNGVPEAPTVVTDTGVQRLTPFQQVVKNHPQVGIAGTLENLAYVAAYKKAQEADDGEKDPVKLGLNLFNPKPNRDLTSPGGELAATPAVYAKNLTKPPAVGAAVAPTMFAGSDTGPTAWAPPVSDAAQAGASARAGLSAGIKAATDPAKSLLGAGIQGAKSATKGVMDFFHSFTSPDSVPATQPSAVAPLPAYQPTESRPGGLRLDTGVSMPAASPLSAYSPDADTQAFAQNPEEDQFRKRMREPVQTSYANA